MNYFSDKHKIKCILKKHLMSAVRQQIVIQNHYKWINVLNYLLSFSECQNKYHCMSSKIYLIMEMQMSLQVFNE